MGANADLVRGYITAVSTGDIEAMAARLDDDAVVHIGGRNMASGDHAKGSWIELWAKILERSGGSMNVEVHDLLESDDHVVALLNRRIAGTDSRGIIIFHVAGGKITEVWPVEMDQYAIDEAMPG